MTTAAPEDDVNWSQTPVGRFYNAIVELLNVAAELAPIFIFCLAVPAVVMIVSDWRNKPKAGSNTLHTGNSSNSTVEYRRHETYLFSLFGALAAYLTQIGVEGVWRVALPSTAMIFMLVLQFLAKAGIVDRPPLNTRTAYQAAGCASITFLFSARYFSLLFGQ